MDYSYAINMVIENYAEYYKPLYMAFIDYEEAFHSIEKQAVLETLPRQGVLDVYVQTTSNICNDCTATLLVHEKSRKILNKRGVRQGDTISPMLFTACLEMFKRLGWEEKGIGIDGQYLSNLRFGDDIVLFSNDGEELQTMIVVLNRKSLKVGL